MPLAILGVLILWFGWFGFNPGSTLGAVGARFADIAVTTNLAAAAGVLGAIIAGYLLGRTIDIGFAGNGAIAGLVAITAPCAYVDQWAACVIGLVAGILMVSTVVAVDKLRVDDPIGAIAGHGMGGIWGTLSCGLFTTTALANTNGVGDPGLFYGGGLHQLGVQALGIAAVFAFVFISSAAVFYACKKTIGLRVNAQQELEGLDIHEHGMWGYPEQFLPGYGATQPYVLAPNRRPQTQPARRSPPTRPCPWKAGTDMQKIEAYIRHEALEAIRSELYAIGLPSMSVSDVLGSGRQAGIVEHYRGASEVLYLRPKLRLDVVVADEDVEKAIQVILTHARSGEIGDGKIFVIPVADAVRIRTGERGEGVVAAHDEAATTA